MPSTSEVLDEATTTLTNEMIHTKSPPIPRPWRNTSHSCRLWDATCNSTAFQNWLQTMTRIPFDTRLHLINAEHYMSKTQIEPWITEWTRNHGKGKEGRVLKNLTSCKSSKYTTTPSMKQCRGCEQPFMTFLLMPIRPYNTSSYDPNDYQLFCYHCCTETSSLLSPGHLLTQYPDHQEHQRALALQPMLKST